MQWHRCPLDPRNNEASFLRRCGINAPDAPGDRRPPDLDDDAELYSVLLMGMRKDMLDSRGLVWTSIQQRVAQLFFAVVGARGPSLQVCVRVRACVCMCAWIVCVCLLRVPLFLRVCSMFGRGVCIASSVVPKCLFDPLSSLKLSVVFVRIVTHV